jgi:cardiolipin synthase
MDGKPLPLATGPDSAVWSDPTLPRRVHVAGQELTLFLESPGLIEALLHDIRNARERVWVEIYIFYHDAAGTAINEALQERARAGVDVRVLYDAIGSQTTPGWFFRNLEKAGARVHAFHSFWEALWRFSFLRVLNRRNHRKVVVIDDQIAYFGGMNLIEPSSAGQVREPGGLPTSSGGWRDVHVRLVGSQQPEVAESFDRSWRRAHGEKIERRPASYRWAQLSRKEESIQFFDTGPGLRYTRASRVFSRLIAQARRSITISMAYFIPVGRVLTELLRARKRGVLIRAIVPGTSDVKIAQWASAYLYKRLLRRRISIHERQQEMLHSKVMVVDNEWVVTGSSNLDARSLWLNLEFMAVIRSRAMARAMTAICRYEQERSRRVTLQECYGQPCWKQWRNRLAWSLRWWL